jgi:hypothetical protein
LEISYPDIISTVTTKSESTEHFSTNPAFGESEPQPGTSGVITHSLPQSKVDKRPYTKKVLRKQTENTMSPDKISKKGKKRKISTKTVSKKLKKNVKNFYEDNDDVVLCGICCKKRKRKNFGYHVIHVYCGITEIVSDWIMKKNGTTFWGKIPFISALCVSDKISFKKNGSKKE